ncbi:hypothetical protein [Bradyrhizobium erythrophlei]|jgi:hypothetical protein|nr:hypothetical protein [Bradyrhizobium erythrophlei]
MAELQFAKRFDMPEGSGEMPLHPPSVAGTYISRRMSAMGSKTVLTP